MVRAKDIYDVVEILDNAAPEKSYMRIAMWALYKARQLKGDRGAWASVMQYNKKELELDIDFDFALPLGGPAQDAVNAVNKALDALADVYGRFIVNGIWR